MKKSPVYAKYLTERNKNIFRMRLGGKSLKSLACEFKLSIRQINRIVSEMSKNVY